VDGDVQPGEPDRLAGGGEPAFPGQPAGHRQRGDRPDPVQPRGQHLRAGQVPGGVGQLVPQLVQPGFQVATSRAVATCSCPAGDR